MDKFIQNFAKKRKLDDRVPPSQAEDLHKDVSEKVCNKESTSKIAFVSASSTSTATMDSVQPSAEAAAVCFSERDIGLYLAKARTLTNEMKMKLLVDSWTPLEEYDFKSDSNNGRPFRFRYAKF